MGWASGSGLMNHIIDGFRSAGVSANQRRRAYEVMIPIFENVGDCDTLEECRGLDPAFDAALGPEGEDA